MFKKILCLLIPFFVTAQTDFTVLYHPLINEAELALCDSNYIEALKLYQEAFKNIAQPACAKDYYNAATCAALLNKKEQSIEYITELARKGYVLDSLLGGRFVETFLKDETDRKQFITTYKSKASGVDIEYRKALQKLVTRHDSVSWRFPSLKYPEDIEEYHLKKLPREKRPIRYHERIDSVRKQLDIWQKTENALILKSFWALVKEKGFPSEERVGLQDLSFLNVIDFGRILFDLPPETREQFDIEKLIKRAVRDGSLSPETAKFILQNYLENGNEYHYGKVSIFHIRLDGDFVCHENLMQKLNKPLWKPELPNGEYLQRVNNARQEIGLEILDDYYTKCFWVKYQNTFSMNHYFVEEITYASSCTVLEKLVENTEVLE